MTRSVFVVLTVALGFAFAGCGEDDAPTNPGVPGSSSNPERIVVGAPATKSLAPAGTYYFAFETSIAGDYVPSVAADQPMDWALYRNPGGPAKAPEAWDLIAACGTGRKVAGVACTVSGLDTATDYILELANRGTSTSTYTLTVTQGMGVGSVNDPVEWVGSVANCSDSFPGQVGTGFSYYKVTDLSRSGANAAYLFNAMSADADFQIYSDPAFGTLLASATWVNGTFDDLVVPVPEGGVFYLRADGTKTPAGTTFILECD